MRARAGRSRRGRQHRHESRQAIGRDQGRLVPGNRGLRGERIHRLGPRGARDRLHRERVHAEGSKPFDPRPLAQRLEEGDEDLLRASLASSASLGAAPSRPPRRPRRRRRRARRPPRRRPRRGNRLRARVVLDRDREALEPRERVRNEPHAQLAGRRLPWNPILMRARRYRKRACSQHRGRETPPVGGGQGGRARPLIAPDRGGGAARGRRERPPRASRASGCRRRGARRRAARSVGVPRPVAPTLAGK